jgi:hypothetical protein
VGKSTTLLSLNSLLRVGTRKSTKARHCWRHGANGTNAEVRGFVKATSLEHQVAQHQAQLKKAAVTEGTLKQLLITLIQHVAERNIPEIKKFIGSYVEKVIIYKEHLELIQKLHVIENKNPQPHAVVDLHGGGEAWLFKTTIRHRVFNTC